MKCVLADAGTRFAAWPTRTKIQRRLSVWRSPGARLRRKDVGGWSHTETSMERDMIHENSAALRTRVAGRGSKRVAVRGDGGSLFGPRSETSCRSSVALDSLIGVVVAGLGQKWAAWAKRANGGWLQLLEATPRPPSSATFPAPATCQTASLNLRTSETPYLVVNTHSPRRPSPSPSHLHGLRSLPLAHCSLPNQLVTTLTPRSPSLCCAGGACQSPLRRSLLPSFPLLSPLGDCNLLSMTTTTSISHCHHRLL